MTFAKRIGIAGLVAAALFAVAPVANASGGGGGGVTTSGHCSGISKWKLGLRPEDANQIQVQFEVEESRPGQTWHVRLADNGDVFFRGSRTTNQFGAFHVRRTIADRAGHDTVTARAKNTVTGEICSGSATL